MNLQEGGPKMGDPSVGRPVREVEIIPQKDDPAPREPERQEPQREPERAPQKEPARREKVPS
jgi:hypothetical protein